MVLDPQCTPHPIQLDNPLMKQLLGQLTKTQIITFNLLYTDMSRVQVNAHVETQRSFSLYAVTNQQYMKVPPSSFYILVIALAML